MVRQTSDVLRRYGALEELDYQKVQSLGRDMQLLVVTGQWFRSGYEQQIASVGVPVPVAFADLGWTRGLRSGPDAGDAAVPVALRRSSAAAAGAVHLDARPLRALWGTARLLGDHAFRGPTLDLWTLRASLEVGIADVSVLP